jgi:SAM-dependent methyltransferase
MKASEFACPRCGGTLEEISEHQLQCVKDTLIFKQVDGIWRFLLPERENHYARFISDYETIRRSEGRGSPNPAYYRALPFQDWSGRFSKDWRIRAASFLALERLTARSFHANRSIHIVDLGAGNGWLSNRMALRGHHVTAVDLLVNMEDGLGAWKYYESQFTPVQAEFMHLPLPERSVSMVLFNASFHYSESYEQTILEALRVLQPDGLIVVMDSPVYHRAESGEQMVFERNMGFISRHGFASDSIRSENYLTYDRMYHLAQKMGIDWNHIRPFYGLRWSVRPWLARMRRTREPAEFGLWVGRPSP